jgi:hypothetical protein
VDATDFELTKTSTANGSINTVTPGVDEHTYDVNVNSVTGDGTLRLDLKSSGTGIKDKDGITFDDITGGFTTGQTYTLDHTAPTLSSVSISSNNANSSSLAKVGDKVTVLFTASEAIGTPTVTIHGQTATVINISGNQWKGDYIMQSTDAPEGTVTFSIGFTDLAGNNGTNVTATTDASSVRFDKTAPTLTTVHIQSNNANTAKAKVGDIVTVSFTTSEPVSSIGPAIDGHILAAVNVSGNDYTISWTMANGDPEGLVTFSIGFTDAAGNVGTIVTATTDASSVTFDRTAPILSPVTIVSNNTNTAYAKVGNEVTLTFTASEAIGTPTVTIATHSVTATNTSGNIWSAIYTMVSGDVEGTVPFAINFSDLTGNAGTQVSTTTNASSVTFDRTAPTLTTVTICSKNSDPA